MGTFPRVVHADGDTRKDLLLGQSAGAVKLFSNIGTDEQPTFDTGRLLQVGDPGFKTDIDVGARATPSLVDWDGDGVRDLVVGALDGKIRVYVNAGSDSAFDFRSEQLIKEGGSDLVVPSQRSSPVLVDLDGDGRPDLLAGNTEGQLLLYANEGAEGAPVFSGYSLVESDGAAVDLPGLARSRPFVCDWDRDGISDVLVGGGDGLVRLYRGVTVPSGVFNDGPPSPATSSLSVYPNPFRVTTIVSFRLGRSGLAQVEVYDVGGRRVRSLSDGPRQAGAHTIGWDGRDDVGREVPSGVYFVRLRSSVASLTAKVTAVR